MVVRRFGFSFLLLVSCVVGCHRQTEGERCSHANGDLDCDGSLKCTDSTKLRKGDDGVDRCCPDDLASSNDSKCAPRTNTDGGNSTGGSDGIGGGGGKGGGGTSSSGDGDGNTPQGFGDKCDYPSDCPSTLTCGPSGTCQYECKEDRDCASGQTCNKKFLCVDG